MRRPEASKKVGGTSSAAVPDPLAGIERRPRPSRRPRGHDAVPATTALAPRHAPSLLDRGEFGAGPLRIDDELEGIELLVLRPQPVEGLTAKMRQGLARRVVQQPQVGEFECERRIAPIQQTLRALDEGLLLLPTE